MNIIDTSQQIKTTAEKLLQEGNVLPVLSEYGETFPIGSFKHGLMWDPDIDIFVISKNPFSSSKHALLVFINQKKFQKYQLGDFKHHPRKDRPKDIILVLIHEFHGKRWEIEIWFKEFYSEDPVDNLLHKMNDSQKAAILHIKKQRNNMGISKHQLNSLSIYKEVIIHDKKDIKEFNLDI